jgi:aerobic carbon-monoxide dehydrogenase medium subunit
MKPVAFEYERPADIRSALALIGREGPTTKILAGGQSLGPMLNLRLVRPELVVDITRIPELKRVEESADAITVGACVTHADIEDGRVPDVTQGALPSVARTIAYRAVRNRGTLGGSLAHADPAADWVTALAAIGAVALIASSAGRRTIAVEDLMSGVFETVLGEAEILEAIRIPRLSAKARWGYYKISRKTGEFAHALGAVLDDPGRGVCRAVMGAIDAKPIVLADARPLFRNRVGDLEASFDAEMADDLLGSAGIADRVMRQIHLAALRRAAIKASDGNRLHHT